MKLLRYLLLAVALSGTAYADTIDSSASNAAYTMQFVDDRAVAGCAISGLTASGATLTSEGSDDNGTTWSAINSVTPATGALSTTLTADGQYRFNVAGRTRLRTRVSSTGTGNISITCSASKVTGLVALSSPIPTGTNLIGSFTPTDSGGHATPAGDAATRPIYVTESSAGYLGSATTYSVMVSGYTAYTTPTELACVWGSATKIVTVTNLAIRMSATASTFVKIDFIHRTTANTAGGSTPVSPTPLANTGSAAATATFTYYTVASPTLGTSGGIIDEVAGAATGLTAAPLTVNTTLINGPTTTNSIQQQWTLPTAADGLCISYAGGAASAWPAGGTAWLIAQWQER